MPTSEERWQRRLGRKEALDARCGEIAGADGGQRWRRRRDFKERAGERGRARAGRCLAVGRYLLDEQKSLEEIAQGGDPEERTRGQAGDETAGRLARVRVLGLMPDHRRLL